ncbi:MAG: hypothetical protein ACRDGA_04240 [Bacteroidota bacterium]
MIAAIAVVNRRGNIRRSAYGAIAFSPLGRMPISSATLAVGKRYPLMLSIGNNLRAIREYYTETLAPIQYWRGSRYAATLPILVEQHISDLDIAHRGPASFGRQRRADVQRFPGPGTAPIEKDISLRVIGVQLRAWKRPPINGVEFL